jgi:hypothetical protein
MKAKIFLVLLFSFVIVIGAFGQEIGLDDDPSTSQVSPQVPPLCSAEDEFGLGLPANGAGLIGPSPTLLGMGFVDSDILAPAGPNLVCGLPPFNYVDGFSANHDDMDLEMYLTIRLSFSVDRATTGVAGSDLRVEFNVNQQMGDIYDTSRSFQNPLAYAGTPYSFVLPGAATPGTNIQYIDESTFGLTAGNGVGNLVLPTIPCPRVTPGSHDNVDSYNDFPETMLIQINYFTIHPAEVTLNPIPPTLMTPCGIYATIPGDASSAGFWATPSSMGLNAEDDSIDALVVWDIPPSYPEHIHGEEAEPGVDCALFSLAPGSQTLTDLRQQMYPVDAATIFYTDFTDQFAIFAYSPALGISSGGSDDGYENVDALEVFDGGYNPERPTTPKLIPQ